MAFKEFALTESQSVFIYKRQSSRSLRLSITSTGQIRVTIPKWAPYKAGLEFARSRQSWIVKHAQTAALLKDGQAIGKAHHLRFVADSTVAKASSLNRVNEIIIRHPTAVTEEDPAVQKIAHTACVRALRRQAEILLPQRLNTLAAQHDLKYKSVAVRQLKSRWGSCDQNAHIILNIYLLQLPWELIDYVLLHELTHTQVLRHGPDFWSVLESYLPSAKSFRKAIKQYQPTFQ
jgi:predicted metal-dependent hydrolase